MSNTVRLNPELDGSVFQMWGPNLVRPALFNSPTDNPNYLPNQAWTVWVLNPSVNPAATNSDISALKRSLGPGGTSTDFSVTAANFTTSAWSSGIYNWGADWTTFSNNVKTWVLNNMYQPSVNPYNWDVTIVASRPAGYWVAFCYFANHGTNISGYDFATGLKAYWKFDNSLVDSSGNNHPLIGTEGYDTGLLGQSRAVNKSFTVASTDDLNFPAPVAGQTVGDFSISIWLKGSTYGAVLGHYFAGFTSNTFFLHYSSILYFKFAGVFSAQAALPNIATQWQHVAIVRSGDGTNNLKVFYNGNAIPVGQDTRNESFTLPLDTGKEFEVGNCRSWGDPYAGLMDEVAVWKGRALTTTEIAMIWNNGNGQALL